MEGPPPRQEATSATRRSQPRREAPAHTGGTHSRLEALPPRREAHAQEGSPQPKREDPPPRRKAQTQAGDSSAQMRGPSARSGWNPFAQTGGPAQTEGSQPAQAAHPRREARAQKIGPQLKQETVSPDGRLPTQTEGPQPRRNPDGSPQPKWELPLPRREPLHPNGSKCHGMCHGS